MDTDEVDRRVRPRGRHARGGRVRPPEARLDERRVDPPARRSPSSRPGPSRLPRPASGKHSIVRCCSTRSRIGQERAVTLGDLLEQADVPVRRRRAVHDRRRGMGPADRRSRTRHGSSTLVDRAPRDVRVDGRGRRTSTSSLKSNELKVRKAMPAVVRRDRGTSDGTAALRLAGPARARPRPGAHRGGPRSSRRVADMAPAMTWLTWKLVRRVTIVVLLILLASTTSSRSCRCGGPPTVTSPSRPRRSSCSVPRSTTGRRRRRVQGAPRPRSRAVARAASRRLIVVTGGKQPGDEFTEAGAGADYLHELGVPDECDPARDDRHTLVGVARRVGPLPAGARRCSSVVLVSDPFHSLRIRLIAEELGFDAEHVPDADEPDRRRRGVASATCSEAVRVAFGEVFGFGRLARGPPTARR